LLHGDRLLGGSIGPRWQYLIRSSRYASRTVASVIIEQRQAALISGNEADFNFPSLRSNGRR
jgi:hypothetical protein